MTDERRRNIKMVYGSLAYDLDTLARERQLMSKNKLRSSGKHRRCAFAKEALHIFTNNKARPGGTSCLIYTNWKMPCLWLL